MMRTGSRKNIPIGIMISLVLAAGLIGLALTGCGQKADPAEPTGQTQTEQTALAQTEQTEETAARTSPRDADEPSATIVFTSDYQEMDGWPAPKDTLEQLLDTVKNAGKRPEELVLCGDYTSDRVLHDYQLSPEDSIEEIRETAQEVFPELTSSRMLFVQGNHDKMTASLASNGLHEYDEYLIYVLNTEEEFPWKQGKSAGALKKVRRSAKEMKSCFDELIRNGETRPVFIAGHVPLHFTARTSSRHNTGDNLYSSLIFDAVNEAGKSLDIIYLFGHNHTKGWDCYLGGGSVYKPAGDTMLIPVFAENDVNTDSFTEEALRFTYLNAGYTGNYMNCGREEIEMGTADEYHAADEALTATVFEIYPGQIRATRYDTEGEHPLGAAGTANPFKGYIDTGLIDEKYYSEQTDSPQWIERSR